LGINSGGQTGILSIGFTIAKGTGDSTTQKKTQKHSLDTLIFPADTTNILYFSADT
jgi:hypothetical protein